MNFYFEAAKTLDRLDAKEGSIKGVLSTLPEKDRKRTAALVIETLKYKPVLLDVIVASKLLKEERKVTSQNLALVLVHDILLSRNGIQAGDGPIKQAILRHKTRLSSEFQRIKIKKGARTDKQLAHVEDARAAKIPRYVRVNTLKYTSKDAIEAFHEQGYRLGDPLGDIPKCFSQDEHIANLFLFPPQTQFQDNPLYTSGKIILQDKASCFPAAVLAPPASNSTVAIDATAAPGNKTSHLSALMGNQGKLYAFERDGKRFTTLKTMLGRAGCRNVEALNADFLTTDPDDSRFSKVDHILLDPSCSGSGIVNRLDYLLDTEEENESSQDERLNKLASFQLLMIKHAMKFPSVQKIVYSTCSVHATENEHVVKQALDSEETKSGHFKLASRADVLPAWNRRGLADVMEDGLAEGLLRCSPGEDATNGFFVSCFVRVGASGQPDLGPQIAPVVEDGNSGKRKADDDGEGEDVERGKKKRPRKKKVKAKASPVLSGS